MKTATYCAPNALKKSFQITQANGYRLNRKTKKICLNAMTKNAEKDSRIKIFYGQAVKTGGLPFQKVKIKNKIYENKIKINVPCLFKSL